MKNKNTMKNENTLIDCVKIGVPKRLIEFFMSNAPSNRWNVVLSQFDDCDYHINLTSAFAGSANKDLHKAPIEKLLCVMWDKKTNSVDVEMQYRRGEPHYCFLRLANTKGAR